MNQATEKLTLAGPAGALQVLRDQPQTLAPDLASAAEHPAPHANASPGKQGGVVVLAHPHPLHGGTMDNKVVQTLARAYVQSGWTAVRFNFRGVGASEGQFDDGRGETHDMLSVIEQLGADGPLALAGFSFGAFVVTQTLAELWPRRDLRSIVLVGTACSRFAVAPVPAPLHAQTLVIHGEQDDTVPLASVLHWARPQALPVVVVPGVEHFFHGQLPLLKGLVTRHLSPPA